VVDFWASLCGPCRMMSPVVEQAANLYAGKFKFCKINVDENPSMAAHYQAMSNHVVFLKTVRWRIKAWERFP